MPKLTKLEADTVVEILGAVVDNLVWDGSVFALSTDFQVTLTRSERAALTRALKKMRLWKIEPGLTCQEYRLLWDISWMVDEWLVFRVEGRNYEARRLHPLSMPAEERGTLDRLLGKIPTWAR